jgi:hypothetical protein
MDALSSTLTELVGLVALACRTFSWQSQPQLLVPTRRFHAAVALDAIRFPKLPKLSVG